MLTNDVIFANLQQIRTNLYDKLPAEVQSYFETTTTDLVTLNYPVLQYPQKIASLSLEKQSRFESKLTGIKGQYLIFEDGTVFNVRASEGFVVGLSIH
jgi:Protein of unknown function (DUF2797)